MKEESIIIGYKGYHSQYWANALTVEASAGSFEGLSRSIANARVDLNPHQVDAALFTLRSPLSNGVVFADEVGLGKTIEAGIVIAQKWAERKLKILLIVPAALRKQWQQELETEQFLIFAAKTDNGRVLDEELCQRLMQLPAKVNPDCRISCSLDDIVQTEIKKKVEIVDIRNGQFFEEEVVKLDNWSDDLKKTLEQEIKELDKQIRQARSDSKLAASLCDKLKFQKQNKQLEQSRNKKRRELFDEQDRIDAQRDELIEKIERQLKQKHANEQVFMIKWKVKWR
jgi:hypothetical protein